MIKINSSDRIGKINYNKHNSRMKIIEYTNSANIMVKFDNDYTTKCTYKDFKDGAVKNPEDKTVCNVGYLGLGNYKTKIDGKTTIQYKYWQNMIERCYNEEYHKRQPTYKNCIICDEWLNFQNFCKWFNENYYEIENEKMCIDKDILIKRNKIYSPETCIFVPQRINSLFVKNDVNRGDCPIGVVIESDKYVALYRKNNRSIRIGLYDTQEQAFYSYKCKKEECIKYEAEYYKDKIPNNLYNAMINYKVEITD